MTDSRTTEHRFCPHCSGVDGRHVPTCSKSNARLSSKQKAFMDMTDIEKAMGYAAEYSGDPSISKCVHVYWLAVLANEVQRLTRPALDGGEMTSNHDKPQRRDGTTHADTCASWGPMHYECALREIGRLKVLMDDLSAMYAKERLERLEADAVVERLCEAQATAGCILSAVEHDGQAYDAINAARDLLLDPSAPLKNDTIYEWVQRRKALGIPETPCPTAPGEEPVSEEEKWRPRLLDSIEERLRSAGWVQAAEIVAKFRAPDDAPPARCTCGAPSGFRHLKSCPAAMPHEAPDEMAPHLEAGYGEKLVR